MKNAIIGFLVLIVIALGVFCTLLVTGKIKINKTNTDNNKIEEKVTNKEKINTKIDETKVTSINYSGTYKSDDSSELIIDKNGDNYTATISIYRLATFEDGKVTDIKDNILTISSTDPSGNPITFTFDYNSKTLKVDKTTWELLNVGDTFQLNK